MTNYKTCFKCGKYADDGGLLNKKFMCHDCLDSILREAKANAEIEGFTFTPEDEKDIKAVLTGKMTREELIEKLKG